LQQAQRFGTLHELEAHRNGATCSIWIVEDITLSKRPLPPRVWGARDMFLLSH